MKRYLTHAVAALALFAFAAFYALTIHQEAAEAATPNATGGAQVLVIPVYMAGSMSTSQTGKARFAMPFPCDMLGVGALSYASSGTTPAMTVDVTSGGTSILSAPVSVNTSTYAEGTITTPEITDESAISINTVITGAGAWFQDVMLMMTCARR
jgi:hypothetical protein